MNGLSRRVFVLNMVAGSSALYAGALLAQTAPMVDEKDPVAVALGYVKDTTKVDAGKFPKHKADQKCSNCALYSGKPGEASGPCGLFPGKLVAADGWCNSWVKKG